ncbi:hypothetical protein MLD38_003336 [Melastoma candidum]|uniref:Uncharacterized protein n=1 Tax=Melastoma candidum TaxID=119954 RepID=A0ACB9S3K9_9MYRT|nr:hypothetical protein MLD38_003336 [Melastoma candidum]
MDDAAAAYLPPPQTNPPPPGTALSYAYYQHQPLPQHPSPPAVPTRQYYYLSRQPIQLPRTQTYIDSPRDDEVRTLFVAGLPDDVKAREIDNLFREFPGYESSHLRASGKNSQPFAFAEFLDHQSAVAAMHALNGMVFDLEKKCTIHIDLAKSNTRSKRPRGDEQRQGFDKRARVPMRYSSATHSSGIGSIHLPGIRNSAYSTIGYPTAQSYVILEDQRITEPALAMMSTSLAPPCPTLFVANLGPRCTEDELLQVFSRCPGFQKVKVKDKQGAPVAFVDFKDTACSTGAMNLLQGTILHSSPAGWTKQNLFSRDFGHFVSP